MDEIMRRLRATFKEIAADRFNTLSMRLGMVLS